MMLAGHGLEYIMDCLLTHYWFALLSGLLGYFLIWIILSRVGQGQLTFRSPFWAGVFFALLSHWIIDTYTNIA